MLKLENTEVFGWEAAIRGMRNPMNSWEMSDSNFSCEQCDGCFWEDVANGDGEYTWCNHTKCDIGENDLKLMKNLSRAGNDHGKFLRMINVTVDITAPLYWWKEFDTYKVGTVANSCSTMHKIHAKEFTLDDFSVDHLMNEDCDLFHVEWYNGLFSRDINPMEFFHDYIIHCLNVARNKYLETKDKNYWWQMIQLLPSSYNQMRTVQLNYQVLKQMYFSRRNHKLDEWHTLCEWMEGLPYFKEVVIQE